MNTSTPMNAKRHKEWVAAIVFMAIFCLCLVMIIQQFLRTSPTFEKQEDALQVDVFELQTKIALLQQNNDRLTQSQEQIGNYLTSLSHAKRSISMAGTELCPDARGTFFIGDDTGILVAYGMAPPPKGEIYQLWLIPIDGVPFPLGRIDVDATLETVVISSHRVDPNIRFGAVGVSIEKETTLAFLTGPIVLLGILQ